MHELAIATDIIDIVERSARSAGARAVEVVELEIGELSGIELDALNMALEISKKDTVMAGSEIKIHRSKGEARCIECSKVSPVDDLFSACPACGSFRMDITKGKEMKIKSIVVCE